MPDRPNRDLHAPLADAFKSLRKGAGITSGQLARKHVPAEQLAELPAVRQLQRNNGLALEQAIPAVLSYCVRNLLEKQTYRIVADSVLALGAFQSVYKELEQYKVDEDFRRDVQALVSRTLDQRRAALLNRWQVLHQVADGEPVGDVPSEGKLRKIIEEEALGSLAGHALTARAQDVAIDLGLHTTPVESAGRVIVIGGVTMDLTFRINEYPDHETSTEASKFRMTPGGKGFMQAIAAARLGLEVSLFAAIANDQHRQVIVHQLEDAGVDTSLLTVIDDTETSLTGIFELPRGDSKAVNWRGTAALTPADISNSAPSLEAADAILLTFEIPHEVTETTLALAATFTHSHPIVIVTPGQPYVEDEKIDHRLLGNVDYLVARKWELDRLFSRSHPELENDDLFGYLLSQGVKHVCLMAAQGATIYSNVEPFTFGATLPGTYGFPNSAISRDAFCAALASQLIESPSTFTDEHVTWATAAMARAAADFTASAKANDKTPGTNSLPNRHRIEERLQTANRQAAPLRTPSTVADIEPDDAY